MVNNLPARVAQDDEAPVQLAVDGEEHEVLLEDVDPLRPLARACQIMLATSCGAMPFDSRNAGPNVEDDVAGIMSEAPPLAHALVRHALPHVRRRALLLRRVVAPRLEIESQV